MNSYRRSRCLFLGLLLKGSVAFAQIDATVEAIQLLKSSKPLPAPSVELGYVDPDKRKIAEETFYGQTKALAALKGFKDPSFVPILIPYLNYTIDGRNPAEFGPPRHISTDLKSICLKWPAFGVIINIPGAGAVLDRYAEETRNPINYRVAAFHVLRYVDRGKFSEVGKKLNDEFAGAARSKKAYLNAIESGELPFQGIYPIDIGE